jgi:cyanophycinase
MTQVAAGLALVESVVIDQHFDQRNRYGRLLMIVSQSPQLLGIGVDEDTAAVVEVRDNDHEVLRVIGRGSVTVFDPARIVSNAHDAKRSAPLLASGVVLHVLPEGTEFDLTSRSLVPAVAAVSPEDSLDVASARHDMTQMARDIAAADASPTALRRRLARTRTARTPRTRSIPPGKDGTPA